MPMPGFQIQLFGSFFLLWRCSWLLITILRRSLSLAWQSIPSPITTFPLLRMRGSSKMAENRPQFWRSVAISSSPSSLYIYLCLKTTALYPYVHYISFLVKPQCSDSKLSKNEKFLHQKA